MRDYRNLVSDSPLVWEIVEMLRVCGGRADAQDVACAILKLTDLDAEMAALVISDLIKDDHRLSLSDGSTIELNGTDAEALLLHEADFVVVDLETTGAKLPPSRIMEIGAYRISQGRIVSEFQTLVNPETNIPHFVARLTGISDQMVKSAPVFADIASDWLHFAGDAVLVAHDSPFDVRFLNHEVARVFPGRRMANVHLCTVKLSRSLIPGLVNYRLHTIAEHLSIALPNRHRAADDAHATAGIFLHVLELLHRDGVRDVAGARRLKVNPERLSLKS
jgi:DNA polymerase III epsilon subunit family exonuclease